MNGDFKIPSPRSADDILRLPLDRVATLDAYASMRYGSTLLAHLFWTLYDNGGCIQWGKFIVVTDQDYIDPHNDEFVFALVEKGTGYSSYWRGSGLCGNANDGGQDPVVERVDPNTIIVTRMDPQAIPDQQISIESDLEFLVLCHDTGDPFIFSNGPNDPASSGDIWDWFDEAWFGQYSFPSGFCEELRHPIAFLKMLLELDVDQRVILDKWLVSLDRDSCQLSCAAGRAISFVFQLMDKDTTEKQYFRVTGYVRNSGSNQNLWEGDTSQPIYYIFTEIEQVNPTTTIQYGYDQIETHD